MMRILFWTGLFPPFIGGLELFGLRLVSELIRRGHEVVVVSMQTGANLPEYTIYDGIPVYRFDFSGTLASKDPRRIGALLKQITELKQHFRPDLVHLNDFTVGVFFHQRTMESYGCPTVYSIHTAPALGFEKNSLLGRMLLMATWLPAVSQAMRARVIECVPEMSARTSVIYNGLPLPTTAPTPLPFEPPHLLAMGRVVADKGFDLAIDALAALLPDFPSLRLTIAGDGLHKPALEVQVERLGIGHAVYFAGWVQPEAVYDLINTATVVLVPSRWYEPFALVAVEAAQMARPVVATRAGGLPEVVLDGQTGQIVERKSSQALAEGVRFLLKHPDEARRMGEAGRKRAAEVFAFSRMVDEYEQVYRQVVNEAAR